MSRPVLDTSRKKKSKISLLNLQDIKETKTNKKRFSIPQGNVSDKNMQKMEGPKVASGRDSRGIY